MTALRRPALFAVGGTALVAVAFIVPTTPRTDPPAAESGWAKRHEAFLAVSRAGGVDVLFLGDSLTQDWAEAGRGVWRERFAAWRPANFGIGGDTIENVLWRVTVGNELDGLDPKVVVLLIGTNNLAADTPDEVAAGVGIVVGGIRTRKPGAKVLLLGLFPRAVTAGAGADAIAAADLHPKVKAVNERLAHLGDGKKVVYLDIGPRLLNAQGGLSSEVMPDFVHLSPKGYATWADAIAGPVGELLK